MYVNETKLDFVSFNDKNLQRRRKFVSERDFLIQNSYTGQVQCLSHSRDQKFVTSLVQSAIAKGYLYFSQLLDFIKHLTI